MDNRETLQSYNNELEQNNISLDEILTIVNNLPEVETDSIVDDYIQDGFVIHYDGVDNGGAGIHNTETNTWIDLRGNINSSIGTNVVINQDSLQTNGGADDTAAKIETEAFNISNEWTIEQRITIDKYTSTGVYSNPADCFLSLSKDNVINWGNYLKNGMLYCNGYVIDTQVSTIYPLYKALTLSTTYDGTEFKNYINGTLVATVPFNFIKDVPVKIMNGPYRYQHSHVTNVSIVKFHSFRYYDRALSEDELHNNYIRDDQLYPVKFF